MVTYYTGKSIPGDTLLQVIKEQLGLGSLLQRFSPLVRLAAGSFLKRQTRRMQTVWSSLRKMMTKLKQGNRFHPQDLSEKRLLFCVPCTKFVRETARSFGSTRKVFAQNLITGMAWVTLWLTFRYPARGRAALQAACFQMAVALQKIPKWPPW